MPKLFDVVGIFAEACSTVHTLGHTIHQLDCFSRGEIFVVGIGACWFPFVFGVRSVTESGIVTTCLVNTLIIGIFECKVGFTFNNKILG